MNFNKHDIMLKCFNLNINAVSNKHICKKASCESRGLKIKFKKIEIWKKKC